MYLNIIYQETLKLKLTIRQCKVIFRHHKIFVRRILIKLIELRKAIP